MGNTLKALTIVLLSFASAQQANAATPNEVISFQTSLSEMNRLKPLQNPQHKLSNDILHSTLIDRENKVIGGVEDVIVKSNGDVQTIYTDLDRLHLGDGLFLDFYDLDIKSASNGYKMGLNSDEIVAAYPSLLANIETAAGRGDMVSIKKLLGSDVVGKSGVRLGEISEILFDQTASSVRSVYLSVDYKTIRNSGVAVPFSALTFKHEPHKIKVMIDQDYADAVVRFAKDN